MKKTLTFAKCASLWDSASILNSSLDGDARRTLDIFEGTEVGASDFKARVREAVAPIIAAEVYPAKVTKFFYLLSI